MGEIIQSTQRERIKPAELQKLKQAGAVFLDSRCTRPYWFDGRFLKASDLNREQNYFLIRQADLAVAIGVGVAEGLMVAPGETAASIQISRGYGRTFAGETVVVGNDLKIDLADIPVMQKINAALGIRIVPTPPLRSRSGLFVIALRPLEFTANPIASYPTDINDRRSLKDGEIIEATAVTLVPYFLSAGSEDTVISRRAEAADQIFVAGKELTAPASSLPLAMVELERGNVRWVDNYLVRREMGSSHKDVLGLGLAPRQLREAHFKQYEQMLEDILSERFSLNAGSNFAASEYFVSLPPAGRLPIACVDMTNSTQTYFPADFKVEISIVPEDEIAVLVEESMVLPPLKLTGAEEAKASTSVMILIPVPRHQVSALSRTLSSLTAPLLSTITPVRSYLKPIDLLRSLKSTISVYESPSNPSLDSLAGANWRSLMAGHEYLWFMRRRNLSYKEEIVGESIRVYTDEFQDELDIHKQLKAIQLDVRFTRLKRRASAAADLAMVRFLSSPVFTESKTLLQGAIKELEAAKRLDERTVLSIASRYSESGVGEGIKYLEADIMNVPDISKKLVASLKVPELDSVARKLSPGDLRKFSNSLTLLLKDTQKKPTDVANFIIEKIRSLEP